MFRPGLLATLSALILTGCVSSYAYRDGDGGDYYYSEPEIEYYDIYGRPYGIIGYGYPGGWYGHFGYFFGPYYPYWRYDHRYGRHGHPGYGHWPPYGHPYRPPQHRPPNMPPADGSDQPRPPRPPGTPPIARPPREDHERENGPWRRPGELPGRRMAPPQPMQPRDASPPRGGDAEGPRRTPFTMSQPAQGGERTQRPPPPPRPERVAPPPRPRAEPPPGRFERPERESRRDPEP